MNKQKDCRISRSIWNKLYVLDPYRRIFVQIRLTQQWSSFSMMILWWSDCLASTTVFLQSISNVKIDCIWWKKKVCRSCFVNFSNNHIWISHKNERIAQRKDITNGKEVNAVENVSTYAHTYIYKLTSCWSVFNNWS